jgi:hypothetical protein
LDHIIFGFNRLRIRVRVWKNPRPNPRLPPPRGVRHPRVSTLRGSNLQGGGTTMYWTRGLVNAPQGGVATS